MRCDMGRYEAIWGDQGRWWRFSATLYVSRAPAEAQNGDGTLLRDLTRSQAITGDLTRSHAPLRAACPLRVYNTPTSGLWR